MKFCLLIAILVGCSACGTLNDPLLAVYQPGIPKCVEVDIGIKELWASRRAVMDGAATIRSIEFSADGRFICFETRAYFCLTQDGMSQCSRYTVVDTSTGEIIRNASFNKLKRSLDSWVGYYPLKSTFAAMFPRTMEKLTYAAVLKDAFRDAYLFLDDRKALFKVVETRARRFKPDQWHGHLLSLEGEQKTFWKTELPRSFLGVSHVTRIQGPSGQAEFIVVFRGSKAYALDATTGKITRRIDCSGHYPSDDHRRKELETIIKSKSDVLYNFYSDHAVINSYRNELVLAESTGRRIRVFSFSETPELKHELNARDPVLNISARGRWNISDVTAHGHYLNVRYFFSGRRPRCVRTAHDIFDLRTWTRVWHCTSDHNDDMGIRRLTFSPDHRLVAILCFNDTLKILPAKELLNR